LYLKAYLRLYHSMAQLRSRDFGGKPVFVWNLIDRNTV
jgi:hypothetical protein